MSSTSDALVLLAQQKEALRVICNRYLPEEDRLPVDCTLQQIIDVFNEYDEYSYMNAFLNSIQVFPDKDYSINDTKGHIKGLNANCFSGNTSLKSVYLPAVSSLPTGIFAGLSNIKYLYLGITTAVQAQFANIYGEIFLPKCTTFVNYPFAGGDYGSNHSNNTKITAPKLVSYVTNRSTFWNISTLINVNLASLISLGVTNQFNDCSSLQTVLLGGYGSLGSASQSFGSKALILTNQTGVSTIGGNNMLNSITGNATLITYVPSSLLNEYQNYTNWVTVHQSKTDGQGDYNGIQDIESNINDLRDLGADFSYTPYANKKWDGTQLVTDSTIGEETD